MVAYLYKAMETYMPKTLGDFTKIAANLRDADVWITRKGEVVDTFDAAGDGAIGIKVTSPDVLVRFLYYVLQYQSSQVNFKGVQPDDLRSIELQFRK